MDGVAALRLGDHGRPVIPAELRARRRWTTGTTLVAIETDVVILAMREELEALVGRQLDGTDVIADLVEERRGAAAFEDRA